MRSLVRRCSVCGEKMKIKLNKDKTYFGGNYFGKMKVPIGKGEWKKVGTSTILKSIQKRTDVVKWTGKEKEVEYWECNKCYEQ